MLKNYLKIAFRNLLRNKLYAFINISGLTIGLAACIMIYYWVQHELSYDTFNKNLENIVRIERQWDYKEMHGQAPLASAPWGPALEKDYPEILNYVRIEKNECDIKDHRNLFRKEKVMIVDNSLFKVFDFTLKNGNIQNALTEPFTTVITEKMALKYTGTKDPIGQSLTVNWLGEDVDFKITGILQETPDNSHVRFDVLLSNASYPKDMMNEWFGRQQYTYLLLRPGTDLNELEQKFPPFMIKYISAEFAAYFGPDEDVNKVFKLRLKPLSSIHLYPSREYEIAPQGKMSTVYIFSAVALLILVIAGINFTNLETAKATKKAKEVGLRKTIGANKSQLLIQQFGESLLTALLSLLAAILLIALTAPFFNNLTDKNLTVLWLFQDFHWVIFLLITVATGILSGLIPAVYLTSLEPALILKGSNITGKGKAGFRKAMVIMQFAISIFIIISTIIIYSQMTFMQNKSLGFDKENIITLPADSKIVRENIDTFRNRLLQHQHIVSVSASSNVPGTKTMMDTNFRKKDTGETYNLMLMMIDYDFVKTYNLATVAGRPFSRDFGADQQSSFLLNERACRSLNLTPEQVIGNELVMTVDTNTKRESSITGVLKDFHLQSLHLKIQPTVFLLTSPQDIKHISIKINTAKTAETIAYIQKTWDKTFPGQEFQYDFLDGTLKALYLSEVQMHRIFIIFAFLSILIACLGLFGLVTFITIERTKEIGIRKVVGASSANILFMFLKQFGIWIIAANILAIPFSWWIMSNWAQNYAYRIQFNVVMFILPGMAALLVACLTIFFHTLKAANMDPVESLRYE